MNGSDELSLAAAALEGLVAVPPASSDSTAEPNVEHMALGRIL